jgi:hypothetical protein
VFAASGSVLGAEVDVVEARQAAIGLSKAADSTDTRIDDLESRQTSREGRVSALRSRSVVLRGFSDRLAQFAKTNLVTGSFIDVGECQKMLGECHSALLDLRREARKLPAQARKGLLKDVMASFKRVERALYGRNGRYPIPHDPLLDE